MWHKNIAGRFFGLVTKHACDRRTDRRTDGHNYYSQDRASIVASRGKNARSIHEEKRNYNEHEKYGYVLKLRRMVSKKYYRDESIEYVQPE